MRRILLLPLLTLLLSGLAWGQPEDIRVLERAEQKATGITKLELLNRMGEYYLAQENFVELYDKATQVLALAEEYRSRVEPGTPTGNQAILLLAEQQTKARLLVGQYYQATGEEPKAARLYRQAFRKAQEINNQALATQARTLLERIDRGTGVQLNLGKVLESAVDELEELIPEEERSSMDEAPPSITVREELARNKERNGNYASAVEFYEGTLAYYEAQGDTATLLQRYEKIRNLYQLLGNKSKAEWYGGLITHMRNPDSPPPLASSGSVPAPRDLSEIVEDNTAPGPQNEEEAEIAEARDQALQEAARLAKGGDIRGSAEAMERARRLQREIDQLERQRREDSLETAYLIEAKLDEIKALKARQELQQSQRNLALLGLAAILVIATLLTYLFFSKRKAHRNLAQTYRDLNQTHEQLKTTQTQLVSAEKMASLGQLTAGIAHEINNPVNFISGNIHPLRTDIDDLLALIDAYRKAVQQQGLQGQFQAVQQQEQELDLGYLREEIRDLLTGIEEGAHRTTEIVSGLRNFARLDNDEYKRFDLHQGLDSTLALLRSHLDGIEVLRDYGDLPGVECYPGKLNQVFMNILTNAIQAMPEGGMIHLATRTLGDEVEIAIRDTGQGMDEKTLDRVFEPFFTTKDVGQGTGLGMSISHGIIRQHHGRIEAQSKVGQGTDILIRLPINQDQASAAEADRS